MDNIATEIEHATKFCSILFVEKLSWKQHINDVSTKISKIIGILKKLEE